MVFAAGAALDAAAVATPRSMDRRAACDAAAALTALRSWSRAPSTAAKWSKAARRLIWQDGGVEDKWRDDDDDDDEEEEAPPLLPPP